MKGLFGALAKAEATQADERGWKQPVHWCGLLAQNLSAPEPGDPTHANNLCKPSSEMQKQREQQEMLGQGFWCCPPPPCQMMLAQSQPQPRPWDMWICHFWDGRKRGARQRSFFRVTSSPLHQGSQPIGQAGGDAGKRDLIYPDILKAYGKCLRIRFFRNQRHYGEIRNWSGERKS